METLKYNLRNTSEPFWFAMGSTAHRKELQIRDHARSHGLDAFVPLRYAVKTVRGQRQRALVPAMSGLFFIKATIPQLSDYITKSPYTLYPLKSTFSNKENFLVVDNHAMENFIAATENNEQHVTYFRPDEISLQQGDKIRISGGPYDGREGIIMRIKGKRNKHLVVQITGVIVAAVELSSDMIIKDDLTRERPSKDITKDKKLLFTTAHRLLFEIPDKYAHENEYYLLLSELKRCRERLKTFRGYTPATEVELALPLYMTAVLLDEDPTLSKSRLLTALSSLKPTSKLHHTATTILSKLEK